MSEVVTLAEKVVTELEECGAELSFFPEFELTSGKVLMANCFKCGDLTAQEHYFSWNPIDLVDPDFHRPDFFGKMILE